jgi:uncharacterized protein Yka (UPF0111/DUF47 family)
MGIQNVIRLLVPKEEHFFDFVEKAAVYSWDAAVMLATFSQDGNTAEAVRLKVQDIEHQGDKMVHDMEEALAKTFVTPIDREDLQRLSSEIDTITDLTNAAARACAWFGVVRPTEPMVKLMNKLVECTAVLKEAVPALRAHEYPKLIDAGRALRQLEKDADTVYRDAVSKLYRAEPFDARAMFRDKEVLDDLENAVDHCERVGHLLVNLAVKHG